jgi:serine protease Do
MVKKAIVSLLILLGLATYSIPAQAALRDTVVSLDGCSAIVIEKNVVLTAAHCVSAGEETAVTRDNVKYPAKVVKIDVEKDIAILASTIQCPCATLADKDPAVDEAVSIIGYPLSWQLDHLQIKTDGTYQGQRKIDGTEYAVTTASAMPGNSGGGLFDSKGRLVGILVGSPGYMTPVGIPMPAPNLTLSVPLNVIKEFIK